MCFSFIELKYPRAAPSGDSPLVSLSGPDKIGGCLLSRFSVLPFNRLRPFAMLGPSFLVHGLPGNHPCLLQGSGGLAFRAVGVLREDASVAPLESGADSDDVLADTDGVVAQESLFQPSSPLFFESTAQFLAPGA